MSVLVAVATYRRPTDLAALLPLLERAGKELDPPASVVVVDNDPEGGAADQVAAHPGITYRHEPTPGIAAARNAALAEARDRGIRWVAFLDDDERPDPGWLAALVRAAEQWPSAAVGGPVISEFESPVDEWVLGSGAFDPRPHAHGASIRGAATNNLLLDRQALDTAGLAFDNAFGLTGGSDSMLTRAMTRRGLLIRWTTEAVVREVVPATRTERAWILARNRRTGNDWSRVELALATDRVGRTRARVGLLRTTLSGVLRGVVDRVRGTLAGDQRLVARGACRMASARGVAEGMFGKTRTEYGRGPVVGGPG